MFNNNGSFQGSGFLHGLPEDVSQYYDDRRGPRLDFDLNFSENGEYFVWIKMKGNSYGNDSLTLGWTNGYSMASPDSKYNSYGRTSEGQWEWEPEFNGPPMSINATIGDEIRLSIWMAEDGVMIDEILITRLKSMNPFEIQLINSQNE